MHTDSLEHWIHEHGFGQDRRRAGERRTLIVIAITAAMMGIEIVSGLVFGSMALLADGLHMGSHAVALGIAWLAYVHARRRAHDPRYSFGTGKVNALGGFTGALLLAIFAALMAWESLDRFLHPVVIAFDQAILVAVLGLLVNGASAFILDVHGHHEHGSEREQAARHHRNSHADHNLRSAYLHVLADALTSLLAIGALVTGKYLGWNWMDPAMGFVGTLLVGRWSIGLLRSTSGVLLDHQADEQILRDIRESIEAVDDSRLTDLHVWSIGPGIRAAEIALVTGEPRAPEHYKALVPAHLGIVHLTVEVHRCEGHHSGRSHD